eukprot:3895965-Rhodomonas_salina.1
MAPSVNRAAERQSLARGCITLSRELVLRDGLSRMTLVSKLPSRLIMIHSDLKSCCWCVHRSVSDVKEWGMQGEISGTLHFFMHKYEEVDRAVRLGDKDYDIALGADHRSREHNDF